MVENRLSKQSMIGGPRGPASLQVGQAGGASASASVWCLLKSFGTFGGSFHYG